MSDYFGLDAERRELGGLYQKYRVTRVDTDGYDPDEAVGGCFVLRPGSDPVAAEAIMYYAFRTDDMMLAHDLKHWIMGLRAVDEETAEPDKEREAT